LAEAAQVLADCAVGNRAALSDLTFAELIIKFEPQDFFDFTHG
jgi:hypothetical protein